MVADTILIDSVNIDIREGIIEFVKVYTQIGKVFTNQKRPISLVYLDRAGEVPLYKANNTEFILMKNTMSYEIDTRFLYLPNNSTFRVRLNDTSKVTKYSLHKETGINSLINFTAFTDFLAFTGDEPHSLVNLEANAQFFLHRWIAGHSNLYIVPSFQPHFHYNRIDSKFDSITINPNIINVTEVFRRYNFVVGIDVTLFSYDWLPNNTALIKYGYLHTSTNIMINDQKNKAVNHIQFFKANIQAKVISNFGIEFYMRHI